jgi:4-hydroxy-tetrahydrodipicolinate reductase
MVINAIHNSEGIACRGAVEVPGHPSLARDVGELVGLGELGVKIGDDLGAVISHGDVK